MFWNQYIFYGYTRTYRWYIGRCVYKTYYIDWRNCRKMRKLSQEDFHVGRKCNLHTACMWCCMRAVEEVWYYEKYIIQSCELSKIQTKIKLNTNIFYEEAHMRSFSHDSQRQNRQIGEKCFKWNNCQHNSFKVVPAGNGGVLSAFPFPWQMSWGILHKRPRRMNRR